MSEAKARARERQKIVRQDAEKFVQHFEDFIAAKVADMNSEDVHEAVRLNAFRDDLIDFLCQQQKTV